MADFQSVFFDLDGTLWDAAACGAHALDIVIENRLRDVLPDAEPEDIRLRFNAALLTQLRDGRLGEGVELLRSGRFREMLAGYGIEKDELVRELTAMYSQALRMKMERYVREGAVAVLRRLREAGLTLGILTGGTPALRRHLVEALGVDHLVDHLVIADVEGFRKPDPRLFTRAAELAGAEKARMLYVGDNPITDVVGANRAGMPVAWLHQEGQMLPEGVPEPDYVIEDLRGVLTITDA